MCNFNRKPVFCTKSKLAKSHESVACKEPHTQFGFLVSRLLTFTFYLISFINMRLSSSFSAAHSSISGWDRFGIFIFQDVSVFLNVKSSPISITHIHILPVAESVEGSLNVEEMTVFYAFLVDKHCKHAKNKQG